MKKVLLTALAVYVFLAPFTYHPDTKLTLRYASVDQGRVFNIYRYLGENETSMPDFHYPPLHFLILKLEYWLLRPIGGNGFDQWLATGSFLGNETKLYSYIFLTKLPLIGLTMISAWLIYRLVLAMGGNKQAAMKGMKWWLFNPITIFSVAIMGQNDIWTISVFLVGLLISVNRPWFGFVVMGLSAGIKSYPLVWMGLVAMGGPFGGWFKKTGLLIVGCLVYGLSLVPFLSTPGFMESVVGSGLMSRILVAKIDIGFGESVMIGPMLLVLVMVLAIGSGKNEFKKLMWWLMTAGLVMIGWSHFHVQWLLWLVPFWSIYVGVFKGNSPNYLMGLIWLVGLGIWLMFDDVFLVWGLVAPIKPELINWPTIYQFFGNKGMDGGLLVDGLHSVLAGLSIGAIFWGLR